MTEMSGVRKSAILLQPMEPDRAAEILKRLPQASVEAVSQEIASLGAIEDHTLQAVWNEFYHFVAVSDVPGIAHAKS